MSQGYDPSRCSGRSATGSCSAGGFGVFLFFALSGYLIYWPFARRDFGGGASIDLEALRDEPRPADPAALLDLGRRRPDLAGRRRLRREWWSSCSSPRTSSRDTVAQLNGVLWSVVVEVFFYATLPLVAIAIARVARGSRRRAAFAIAAPRRPPACCSGTSRSTGIRWTTSGATTSRPPTSSSRAGCSSRSFAPPGRTPSGLAPRSPSATLTSGSWPRSRSGS